MILEHFSSRPVVLDKRSYDQRPNNLRPIGKPEGLWVSVKGDNDWPSWCCVEGFGKERLLFRHRVDLRNGANILVLDTVEKMHAFNETYGSKVDDLIGRSESARILGSMSRDWAGVAAKYDGIIIAPYHWSLRMANEFSWYYGWDCASGCVWNLDAIEFGPSEVVTDIFMEGQECSTDAITSHIRVTEDSAKNALRARPGLTLAP